MLGPTDKSLLLGDIKPGCCQPSLETNMSPHMEVMSPGTKELQANIMNRLKHCADSHKGSNGLLFWVVRRDFRISLEEELRRMVTNLIFLKEHYGQLSKKQ